MLTVVKGNTDFLVQGDNGTETGSNFFVQRSNIINVARKHRNMCFVIIMIKTPTKTGFENKLP